ncbi:MAG TPA: NTP transferase domain-containing protein [bacterium]|jgi:CMP-N-acetylneuraminic acid synthetase
MNAAIITARAGSKSIVQKNVYPVAGRPLIAYPIQAAREAARVDAVYISTDGEEIADVGRSMGCEVIWRPDELTGDHVNHGDVIKHAVESVDAGRSDLANVVLLLGNTVMVDAALIDRSLTMLEAQPDLDSVISVWEAADDHPFRALQIDGGLVSAFGEQTREVSTERQSYPKAYYYDQGVWTFRKGCVQRRDGPNPWWWMGRRCAPIVRPWVTGRDIHTLFDAAVAEWWIQHEPEIRAILASITPPS